METTTIEMMVSNNVGVGNDLPLVLAAKSLKVELTSSTGIASCPSSDRAVRLDRTTSVSVASLLIELTRLIISSEQADGLSLSRRLFVPT